MGAMGRSLGVLGVPSMFMQYQQFKSDPIYGTQMLNPGASPTMLPDGSASYNGGQTIVHPDGGVEQRA